MPATLPAVLAQPPWPPARKRNVLALVAPAREERIVWGSWTSSAAHQGERESWAHPGGGVERKLEPWERQEILLKLEMKEIVRIDAATNLEMSDLVSAMRKCEPRFIDHYGIARAALAKYGLEVLDAIFELTRKAPSCALEVLLRVDSLRVPAQLAHDDEMRMRWSAHHPVTAALALVPAALGPEGQDRKAAVKFLARMRREGYAAAIREAAVMYGSDAIAEIDALFGPEPLPSRAPKLPPFVDVPALPMPRLSDGTPIGDDAHERLLQLLSLLPLGAARDAIASARPACDGESLATLAGKLAEAWVAAGAETKHKWALLAAGALGDDIVARKLAEWTVEWAKEGAHPRSRVALEALSLVGSDVALMHVDRIARTMKGALRTNATATLEAIASERGLSQEELGDRLVPTLGLDPSASTWLDFGSRRFRVSFDEALVPELFDEAGTRLPRMPRATKDDDAERAARAIATFKGFVSDAKKLAPDQVRRLERAMCAERTWSVADFRRFFVDHPLMIHLARRLVWLADGGVTFRVTEDRTFAGIDDRELALGEAARARIAHPITIASAVPAWSTVLTDYLIVQPFPQLGREVFTLGGDEAKASTLGRFEGRAVAGNRFFTLKHRGWAFHDYAIGKAIRGGFVAMLETEPGLDFLASRPADQTLGELSLRREAGGAAAFGELAPIDASELIRDVELLVK